jgi:hypothetical protein
LRGSSGQLPLSLSLRPQYDFWSNRPRSNSCRLSIQYTRASPG